MKRAFSLTLTVLFLFSACSSKEKPAKARTVVYVDMVADMFHPGHVAFLKQARAQGDYLIVGLMSDELAESYKRKPIMTLEERATMVRSCRYVDEVIEACPLAVTAELIDSHGINLVVHGDDYNAESIKAYYQVAVDRGIFKMVPYTPGVSTSDIIKRIVSRGTNAAHKNIDTGTSPSLMPSEEPPLENNSLDALAPALEATGDTQAEV